MKRMLDLSVIFLSLILVGCSGGSTSPSTTSSAEPAATSSTESPKTNSTQEEEPKTSQTAPAGATSEGSSSEVTTEMVSWEEVQKIVASYSGKIVVLDLWSTYCPPCIKELPGLRKLQDSHPDDVVALTLNCNFNGLGTPEDEREEIVRVLTEVGAKGRNLVSSEADQDLYKRIGVASVPVVYVYNRTGQLAKQFDNEKGEYDGEGFTYEAHIAPLVESLVK